MTSPDSPGANGPAVRDPGEPDWAFDPPPVGRGWRWLAILAPLVAVAVVAGSAWWLVRSDQADARGYLDDPQVTTAVSRACSVLTTTVTGLPVGGPRRLQEAVLDDQTLAIETMVEQVQELGPAAFAADRPLEEWLADWGRLAEARRAWAERIGDGEDVALPVPRDADGDPITERMDRVADGSCSVPDVLLDPRAGQDIDV